MATFSKPKLFTPAVGARGLTELHFAAFSGDLEGLVGARSANAQRSCRGRRNR